jgi:tRNA pseudouridine32 synthase/23S rRNA pseudouridine746 synthase
VPDAATPLPIQVLYTDDEVVVVAKPAGLPVIPAAGEDPAGCVRHVLEAQLGEPLWVVHRLDREASGVLLLARHAAAHRRLSMAFEHRLVSKTYAALTAGIITPCEGVIDVPLHAARRGRARPALPGEAGQASTTEYRVLRTWRRGSAEAALVEARPRTGRHHQIRVHLRSAGTPILFDDIYGRATVTGEWSAGPCRRLALHATRLEWPAAADGVSLGVDAPLAADLAALGAWFDATSWLP